MEGLPISNQLSIPATVTQIIAGENITIDQPNGNVTINSSGGGGGGAVVSVAGLDGVITLSSPDSSLVIDVAGQDIEFSSNGVISATAGTGISIEGTNAITINNSGVTAIGDGTTPAIGFVTLEAGLGVSILNTAGTFVFENTGVLELTGGDGIGLDVQTGSVTVSNLGLLTATAGAGIGAVTDAGDVTITNEGVLSVEGLIGNVGVVAGDGIGVGVDEANNLIISNTGITALDAGLGIDVEGSTITNGGVLSVAAITGAITLSATGMTITPAGQNINFGVPAAPIPSINGQTGPITVSAEAGMGVVTAAGTIALYNVARPYTLLGATIGGIVTNVIGSGSGHQWPGTTFNLASTIQINVPPTYSAGQSVMFDGFAYYNFASAIGSSFWAIYYVTSTQPTEQSLIGVKLITDSIAAPASVSQIYLPMNLTIPPTNLVPGGTITIRVYGYVSTSGEYLSSAPLIDARVGLIYP